MVGYGAEDSHFVVELTYNYNISSYKLGNDFQGITIQSSEVLKRARTLGWPVEQEQGRQFVSAPGGYKFYIIDQPEPGIGARDPVVSVAVGVTNMERSLGYWAGLLGMSVTSATSTTTSLTYNPTSQASLVLVAQDTVDHAKAGGRIAFSIPSKELPGVEAQVKEAKEAILTPLACRLRAMGDGAAMRRADSNPGPGRLPQRRA